MSRSLTSDPTLDDPKLNDVKAEGLAEKFLEKILQYRCKNICNLRIKY
jgi:hypothetical protein